MYKVQNSQCTVFLTLTQPIYILVFLTATGLSGLEFKPQVIAQFCFTVVNDLRARAM